ncbi:response regulator receiver [Opitutaceae bacterium TAV5]|nr:response regulator receiver [Opitutaceae bacterium TAV5]
MKTGQGDKPVAGRACVPAAPLRLLHVESHWLSRKVLWWLMKDVPCGWTHAGSAGEAVALAVPQDGAAAPFDVIIVDHEQTEDDSGLRVVRALREAGHDGPVIAVTVDEITDIEKKRYADLAALLLFLSPGNVDALKTAVAGVVADRTDPRQEGRGDSGENQ